MSACPRCRGHVDPSQEYCLGCGARLPVQARSPEPWLLPGPVARALAALVVAALGATLAIAMSGGRTGEARLATATGGFPSVPSDATLPAEDRPLAAAGWPPARDGWTIVLGVYPQAEGRRSAALRAREARRRGLRSVGILDSSSYASLRPGYWVVFTGIYGSEAEATSDLPRARRVVRGADVRRIVR